MNINRSASPSLPVMNPSQAGEPSKTTGETMATNPAQAHERGRRNSASFIGKDHSLPKKPRSLSESRLAAMTNPQATDEFNEPVVPVALIHESLDAFVDFLASHHNPLHEELASMRKIIGDLSNSLTATQGKKEKLENTMAQRRAGAIGRAKSRDKAINGLQADNKDLQADKNDLLGYIAQSETYFKTLLSDMQTAMGGMENRLNFLDTESTQKSKAILSRDNTINQMRQDLEKARATHLQVLEPKDRKIADVKQQVAAQLAAMKAELDSEKRKNGSLQQKLDALESTKQQFTPAKSEALRNTSKKIADEAETLKELNQKLFKTLKETRAENTKLKEENKDNMAEIATLKGAVEKLAKLNGVSLT